jgi:hypothetical protein
MSPSPRSWLCRAKEQRNHNLRVGVRVPRAVPTACGPRKVPTPTRVYGAASVGQAVGHMVAGNRFRRSSCVTLDGDKGAAVGCLLLPDEDAPERVVFEALQERGWGKVHERTGRGYADVADACNKAMALADHHGWVRHAASELVLSGDTLRQAMCAEWATVILAPDEAQAVTQPIADARCASHLPSTTREIAAPEPAPAGPEPTPVPASPTEPGQLFERWPDAPQN